MPPSQSEILTRLRATIAGWKAEVSSAQAGLGGRIAHTHGQLDRLTQVLEARGEHATQLAAAQDETHRLKRALEEAGLPPGSITRYAADASPALMAARKDIHLTGERIHGAVQLWAAEVAAAHNGLAGQIEHTAGVLDTLLEHLDKLEEDREALLAPLKREVEARDASLLDVRRRQGTSDARIDRLVSLNETLQLELDAERTKAAKHAEAARAMEARFAALESDHAAAQAALLRAQSDASGTFGETENLRASLAARDAQVDELSRNLATATDRATTLAVEFAALREHADATATAATGMRTAQAHQAAEALAAAVERFAYTAQEAEERWKSAFAESDAALSTKQQELLAAENALSEIEAKFASAESDRAKLSSDLDLTRQDASNLRDALAAAEGLHGELESARVELEQARVRELATLQSELEQARNETVALQATLAETTLVHERDTERIASMDTRAHELEAFEKACGAELSDYKEKLHEYESHFEGMQAARLAAEFHASELASTLAANQANLAALEEQRTQLSARVQELAESLARVETQRAGAVGQSDAMHEVIAAAETRERELAARAEELSQQCAAAAAHHTELDAALKEAASEAERERLRSSKATAEAEAARIQLAEQATRLVNVDQRAAEQARTIEMLSGAGKEQSARAERAEDMVKIMDGRLARNSEAIAAAKKREDDKNAQLRTLGEQLTSASQSIEELRMQIDDLEQSLGTTRTEFGERESALTVARATIAQHEAATQQLAEEHDVRVRSLEQQFAREAETVAELQKHIGELETTLNQSRNRTTSLDIAIAEASASVEDTSSALQNARDERDALREAKAALDLEIEGLRDSLSRFEKETEVAQADAEAAKSEQEKAESESAETQSRVSELSTELEAATRNVDERERLLIELRSEIEASQARLDAAQSEAASAHTALVEKQAEVDQLRADHAAQATSLQEGREAAAALQQELAEQREAVRALSEHSTRMQGSFESLRSAEQQQTEAARALAENIARLQAESSTGQTEVVGLRDEIETQKNTIFERDQKITELHAEIARVEQDAVRADASARAAGDEAAVAIDQLNTLLSRPAPADDDAFLTAPDGNTSTQKIVLAHVAGGEGAARLGEVLLAAEVISAEQLARALEVQRNSPGKLLGGILSAQGDATEEEIAQAVSCQAGFRYIQPTSETVERDAATMVARDLCVWHVCIPLKVNEERIVIAMANPFDAEGILDLETITSRRVAPVVATPTDILDAIDAFYGAG